jgi:RNA polymerase sigma-70 factor (ECF subfamily)
MAFEQVIGARWAFAAGVMAPRPPSATPVGATRPPPALPAEEAERARLVALVARMARRDEPALAEFYDRTAGKAYAMALRVAGNAALAEEVVADAFHQAWRDAARYDPARSGPVTWLLMMCRSRALDALRARDPALLHEAPETLVPEADCGHADDPLDLLAAVERGSEVHAALGELSPAQRQMLGLAFFRGLTHQEIAAQTGLPLGTVKSQIRRALDAMRQRLSAVGP